MSSYNEKIKWREQKRNKNILISIKISRNGNKYFFKNLKWDIQLLPNQRKLKAPSTWSAGEIFNWSLKFFFEFSQSDSSH